MSQARILLRLLKSKNLESLRQFYYSENVSLDEFLSLPVTSQYKCGKEVFVSTKYKSRLEFYHKNNDLLSIVLIERSLNILLWILDEISQQIDEYQDFLVNYPICHKLVDVVAEQAEHQEDILVQFFETVKNHEVIKASLLVENINGFRPLEYAVIKERYKLALSFLHTEDVHYRIVQDEDEQISQILEYDLTRYSRDITKSPLFIASTQHGFHGARNSLKQKILLDDPLIEAWSEQIMKHKTLRIGNIFVLPYLIFLSGFFLLSSMTSYLNIYSDYSADHSFSNVMNKSSCKLFKNIYKDWIGAINIIYALAIILAFSTFGLFYMVTKIMLIKSMSQVICKNMFSFLWNVDTGVFVDNHVYYFYLCIVFDGIFYFSKAAALTEQTDLNSTGLKCFDLFLFIKLLIIIISILHILKLKNKLLFYLYECSRYAIFLCGGLSCIVLLVAWFISFVIPCDTLIYYKTSRPYIRAIYYTFRLLLNFSDFYYESFLRLSVVHILFVILFVFFFINFIIALLSDHVAALSSHIDYHFAMQNIRFSLEAFYLINALLSFPFLRKWKREDNFIILLIK